MRQHHYLVFVEPWVYRVVLDRAAVGAVLGLGVGDFGHTQIRLCHRLKKPFAQRPSEL